MVALLFTLLIAVYLLGPALFARFLLGLVVPRKVTVQSRSEEISTSTLWAAFPFALAWWIASVGGVTSRYAPATTLKIFISGLLSEALFHAAPEVWYTSALSLMHLNLIVLAWMYGIVFLTSIIFMTITRFYGWSRRQLPEGRARTLLARFVLPRVAEWHVLLSDMLLPNRDLSLHADVLTRTALYQGIVQDKVLGIDGTLRTLTLGDPKRFQKVEYDTAKQSDAGTKSETYWREIPGNLFVILGSEIVNVNLRYVPKKGIRNLEPSKEQREALRTLLAEALKQI